MTGLLNIAHRGFTQIYPDNTLEAFKAAMDLRVDGIEFDIQETADQRFVVYHDSELLNARIQTLQLAEIESFRIRGKYNIPLLEEVLDLCGDSVKLIIELKEVTSLASLVSVIKARTFNFSPIIASFNQQLIEAIQSSYPKTDCAMILEDGEIARIKMPEATNASNILLKYPIADKELLMQLKMKNLGVYIWGCDTHKQTARALNMEINGIITDFPDFVKYQLAQK